jgi:hypothetical protein
MLKKYANMTNSARNVLGVLDEAVSNFMTAVGEGHHEDVLRAFFRLKVVDIGPLLIEVVATAKRASREAVASVMPEANGVLVVSSPKFEAILVPYSCRLYSVPLLSGGSTTKMSTACSSL